MLESALARPINHFNYGEENIAALATVLLFGIAKDHPFEQGNKRTALECALRFLEINGYAVSLPDTELLGEQILAVLTGEFSEEDFGLMLGSCLREIDDT